jgi:hypothetical protein
MKFYFFVIFIIFSECYAFEALASLRSSVETNSSKIERKYFNYYEDILIKIAKSNGLNDFNYSDISIKFVCNGGCYNKKEPFLINISNKNNHNEEIINELFALLEKY